MNKCQRLVWSESQKAFSLAEDVALKKGKSPLTRQHISQIAAAAILSLTAGQAMAADVCGSGTTTLTSNTTGQCRLGNGDSLVVNPGAHLDNGGASTAVYLPGGRTGGGITNNGIISNTAGFSLIVVDGTLTGDIINNGTLGLSLGSSTALKVSGVVQGDVVNNGTVLTSEYFGVNGGTVNRLVNGASGVIGSGDRGLYLRNSGTVLNGITNSGTINSSNVGIGVDGALSRVDGGIWNYGYIRADGEAVVVNSASISGGIHNYGTIIGTYGVHVTHANVSGGITNSGTITATGEDGIEVYSSTVSGDILNTETGVIEGTDEDALEIQRSVVLGNVINNGLIREFGSYSTGVFSIRSSSISGYVSNSGTIVGTSESYGLQVNSSTISGGIENSWAIFGYSAGLNIEDNSVVAGIVNSGLLGGLVTAGLNINSSLIAGSISNSGTISGGSSGIYLYGSTVAGDLSNSGTISAHLTGVLIDGSNTLIGGLINSGTISGTTGNSVYVSASDSIAGIFITGDNTAKFIGDVRVDATNTSVAVASGATYTMNDGQLFIFNGGGSSAFINRGTLAMASGGVGTVAGNYTQGAGGTFRTNATSNSVYGQMVVAGTATLPGNAKIDVSVTGAGTLTTGGTLADVLTAGTLVSDGTFRVTDSSFLFNFDALKDGNTVDLIVRQGKTVTEAIQSTNFGPGAGAAAVFDGFIQNGGASGDMQTVLNALGQLPTGEDVANAVEQALPLLTGGGNRAVGNALASGNQVVQARQESNSGMSGGDISLADEHVWGKMFGSWANQDDRSNATGFTSGMYGLIFGGDATLDDNLRTGVAVSYSKSAVNSNDALQHARIDSYQLIGYGSYSLDARTELNMQADVSLQSVDGERRLPVFSRTAKADYSGQSGHVGVGVARTFTLGDKMTVAPGAHVDYTLIHSQGYTETGAGALNLKVQDQTSSALVFGTGAKLKYDLTDSTSLRATVDVGYDAINDEAQMTSSFVGGGATFTTNGISPSPLVGRAGLGLATQIENGTEFVVGYDLEGRNSFLNQTGSLKVRLPF